MVFSSITFIYNYLPLVLLFYLLVPYKYKNIILLIFSLLFYFYKEYVYIWILLLSIIVNFFTALYIEKNEKNKKRIFILSIIFNIGLLCYFKYTNFFIDNINNILNINIKYLNIIMPIGISFFTFQTLSYIIDVYNKKVKAAKNIINFACYVSLFPQLIAGPIVRYKDVNDELIKRKINFQDFSQGVERFVIGLAKKVLIANIIGEMIDILGNLQNESILSFILIAIGFTLQIYFDFSGYSDMAIGLGKMLGFHFLENFNYPFIAKSITDFWRRWHISLSSFFKDYVYIPLGGNKVGKIKHIRNIFIVWFLTGFWHGAAWNFIIWGVYFGIILIVEKYFIKNFLEKHKIFSHLYTIILIIISFIIFNANNLTEVIVFFKNMFGFTNLPFTNFETNYYLKSYLVILIISIIASTPILKNIYLNIKEKTKYKKIISFLEIILTFTLLIIITSFLIDASFNPFLYFRF